MPFPKSSFDREVVDTYQKSTNDKYPFLNVSNYFPGTRGANSSAVQLTGNVAGWRQAIADHRNATTTLQGTRQKISSQRGYASCTLTNGANLPYFHPDHSKTFYEWYGALVVGGMPSIGANTSLVSAESQAAEIFLAKARRALSSFQGGVFIAELGKAIRGIRQPAESLKRYLQSHVRDAKRVRERRRRRRPVNDRQLNAVVSDLWLERSYQWLPLCADMENAAESLARLSQLEDVKFVSAEGFSDFASDSSDSFASFGPLSLRYRIRYMESRRVRFYGQVRAFNDMEPGSFSDLLRKRLGLTLGDALPTAWELIPFSFVADYFSNVGAMISAYSFPTANLAWLNRAILEKAVFQTVDYRWQHSSSSASQRYEYGVENPGSFRSTNESFLRTPFDADDLLPSFRLKVPGIDGWPKWLNLAALANSIRQ